MSRTFILAQLHYLVLRLVVGCSAVNLSVKSPIKHEVNNSPKCHFGNFPANFPKLYPTNAATATAAPVLTGLGRLIGLLGSRAARTLTAEANRTTPTRSLRSFIFVFLLRVISTNYSKAEKLL